MRAVTEAEAESLRYLVPFVKAGHEGLRRARWQPGMSADDLVAPIVVAVLVEVAKTFDLAAIPDEAVIRREVNP